ncbi:hypothetical protein [Lysobacter enzymogenes]|uniref:Uncharacterized protein n=1 Tax=Lysobacter enzymogenes TaxID=69 RepID=A0A3N2RI61_LYSEN|nr:hypothetical protein [Lysobacter enzymogenes]ROU07026.1 hypothetical protein D9T17_10960 [Lysobacter enzymogenes]
MTVNRPEIVLLRQPIDNDNIDAVIRLPDDEARLATFFTLAKIASFIASLATTDEAGGKSRGWRAGGDHGGDLLPHFVCDAKVRFSLNRASVRLTRNAPRQVAT